MHKPTPSSLMPVSCDQNPAQESIPDNHVIHDTILVFCKGQAIYILLMLESKVEFFPC